MLTRNFVFSPLLCVVFILILSETKAQVPDYPNTPEDREARMQYLQRMLINPKTRQIPENIREKELSFVYSSQARLLPVFRKAPLESGNQPLALSGQDANWQQRGPFNVGGRTRALAMDLNNENILLAGGVSGGMWRSIDGGASWTKTTDNSELQSVSCIAQDPRVGQTNVWYYGTGELTGNSASGGLAPFRGDGIYRSTDNGVTWTLLPNTGGGEPQSFNSVFQYVWNILVDPLNGDVYAATFGGILRSQDGGASWNLVLGGTSADYTDIAVTSTGVFYATLSSDESTGLGGVYRSVDGTNWVEITPLTFPVTYLRNTIGLAPSNENVVYFFVHSPGSGVGSDFNQLHSFFKYTYTSAVGNGDGSEGNGGSWEDRTANLPSFGPPVGDLAQGSYNQFVKVKPDDENVVFLGSTNLHRSTDGYATDVNTTWIGGYATLNNVSVYPNHHPDNHALIFPPSNPDIMYSGTDGGVSRTLDNLATTVLWESLNNGYYTTQAYTIAIEPNTGGDARMLAGFQDNGKWYTDTNSPTVDWEEEIGGGDGSYVAIIGTNIRYTSTQFGAVARVEGPSASLVTNADHVHPSAATGQLFINPFVLDENDPKIMYYPSGEFLWRHNDVESIETGFDFNGTNDAGWLQLSNSQVPGSLITALAVSKSNPANVLYYGTIDGEVYKISDAHTGGPVPVDVWSGKGFPVNAYVSCISVDPDNADRVVVVFSNYEVPSIFSSTDGGATWTDVSGNLEENPDGSGNGPSVRWFEFHTYNGERLFYAGTSTGLYSATALNGASTSWMQEGSATIGNVVVPMVVSREVDGLVGVATHANGLYSANVVVDNKPPLVLFRSPAPGSSNVPVATDLLITFDEEVQPGSGNIVIRDLSNDQIVLSIDVTTPDVMVSGAFVTVDPPTGFPNSTTLYIEIDAAAFEDVNNNPFAGISGSTNWSFTTVDNTAPIISVLDPTDNATDVPVGTDLVITFNKAVQKGTGNIAVRNISDDQVVQTVDVNSADVTILGAIATIDLPAGLADKTAFYIEIDAGAFEDTSGNDFLGITGNSTWNFTTEDNTAPLIQSLSPPNGATGVPLNTDLVITLDEEVGMGAGNIDIKRLSDDVVFQSLSVASSRVVFNGNAVEMDPPVDLEEGVAYYVEVPADAFRDLSGNSFPGFSGSATWSFNAQDQTAPVLVTLDPAHNATAVPLNTDLTITFNEDIFKGTGNILLLNQSNDAVIQAIDVTSGQVVVTGSQAIINPNTNLPENTTIYVLVAGGAFRDGENNFFSGVVSNSDWTFTTGDATAPSIISREPADDAVDIAVNSDLTIVFSESIQKGNGNVVIRRTSDNSIAQSIAVTSGLASLNNATVVINPTDFEENTSYFVEVDNGAFQDIAGNAFPGIVGNTTWNFRTEDLAGATIPTVEAFIPANGSILVPVDTDLRITFSGPVQKGSGFIRIRRKTDGTTEQVLDVSSGEVSIIGNVITINPQQELSSAIAYFVEIDPGTFQDLPGNDFAGITGENTWRFTTVSTTIDRVRPQLTDFTPVNGTEDVPLDIDLEMRFDEEVKKGSGNVVIRRKSDEMIAESINVNTSSVFVTSTAAIIELSSPLESGTEYYVEVEAGAFEDTNNNNFRGISGTDPWGFTTVQVEVVTNIEDALQKMLKVYPNPATARFKVVLEGSTVQLARIEMYSESGVLVKAELMKPISSGSLERTISLSDVAPGTYLLRVVTSSHLIERKLVVK